MSATAARQELDFDLVLEDGEPVEKVVHLLAMMLFRHLARLRLQELGPDFYVGANQFVYYSHEQGREVAEEERQLELFREGFLPEEPEKKAFRGPDAFVVRGVAPRYRDCWIAWEEENRLPDLVLELLSPSTAKVDYGEKKRIYQDVFRSSEYFLYEPGSELVDGYRLLDHTYQRLPCSDAKRLWSRVLQVDLGVWHGEYEGVEGPWLRLFYPDGRLVLTEQEQERQRADEECRRAEQADRRAEQADRRAEQERQAKEAAEIETRRLRARLAEFEGRDDGQD